MAEKKGGRPSYEGVIHTWKVPSDVEELFKKNGINWIWDAVRQYAQMGNMEKRYVLTPLGGCLWEVKDTRSCIAVRFVEGLFDSTKEVDASKQCVDVMLLKDVIDQMCDYVKENHQVVTTCNVAARTSAIDKISAHTWFHIVSALNSFWNTQELRAKLVLSSELEDYFAYETDLGSTDSAVMLQEIGSLTEDEAKEVLAEVELFWFAEVIPFTQWVKGIKEWHKNVDETAGMKQMENKLYLLTTERLKGYVKDNWRKRTDISKGCYIDTLRHYNDDIEEVYDNYLKQAEGDEALEKRAQSFLSGLEDILDEVNNDEGGV